jgi:uncharacterized SAM-binding protein YcdF (DUF218 family)
MKLRPRWKVLLIVIVGLSVLYVSRARLLPAVALYLDISQEPIAAEYVLVLNGAPETRPFVAAALVNAGLAERVLLTTASPTPATDDGFLPAEQDIAEDVLLARGVSSEQIHVIPGAIASTHDEALALARFLESNPAESVTIVTCEYHTRRARWVFQRALGNSAPRLSFVGAPVKNVHPDNWWKSEDGAKIYAKEFCKFAYYLVRY